MIFPRSIAFHTVVLLLFVLSATQVRSAECNLSQTNKSCTIIIDRKNPVAPPNIQMFEGQTLTVQVKNPFVFERYFLDYGTGTATLTPDVASSIVQGLVSPLGKLVIGPSHASAMLAFKPLGASSAVLDKCQDPPVTGPKLPKRHNLKDAVPAFKDCLAQFATEVRKQVYAKLEPYVAPDSLTPSADPVPGDATLLEALRQTISSFETSEFTISSRIGAITSDDSYKALPEKKATATTAGSPAEPPDPTDQEAITELTNLQKAADNIAADLLGYDQRIFDLLTARNDVRSCGAGVTAPAAHDCNPITLASRADDPEIYRHMVSRSVTYSLDSLNLISNLQEATPDPSKKRAIASITIVFADKPTVHIFANTAYRWEAAAGVFFSTLPVRTYSAAPVYQGTVLSDHIVHLDTVRPTVVPFAAANYRLSGDLGNKWKSNLYWTFAIGVNPNTTTADFGTGPSISWRAFTLSALAHWGHETRLSNGFTVNEKLGADFSGTIPTNLHWTTSFALGISVRIPALVGR